MRMNVSVLCAALLSVPFVLPDARAMAEQEQDLRDVVEQALDQTVKHVQIDNLPLQDALRRLEKQTGLRFVIDPAAAARMPYGERTQISITVNDMALRGALTQVFDGLGLAMRIENDRIILESAAVVQRLGRRLTAAEVGLLGKLAAGPWQGLRPNDVPMRFEIDPQSEPQRTLDQALAATPGANAARQMETATQALGWTWMPQGDAILLLRRADFVRSALNRPVDLNYQRVPLADVLADLGRKAGVTVLFEPDSLRRVDARERAVDLIQKQATVRQALERLCGTTGLRFEIVDDGVQILAPTDGGKPQPSGQSAKRPIAYVSVPMKDGVSLILPIFEGELSADAIEKLRQRRLAELKLQLDVNE